MEGEPVERVEKTSMRPVEELLQQRSESEITVEATVDTGFEFMAMEECREKFGKEFVVMKERGCILFNIDKSRYPEVLRMRSVDNLHLVLSYVPSIGLKGLNAAEDVEIAKKQAHTPDWDRWLKVWKELSGFEGITNPTLEQYAVANERATKDKEEEKIRQAERQKKYKERQERFAEKQARRKAKADLRKAQRDEERRASRENKCVVKENTDENCVVAKEASKENTDENCVESKEAAKEIPDENCVEAKEAAKENTDENCVAAQEAADAESTADQSSETEADQALSALTVQEGESPDGASAEQDEQCDPEVLGDSGNQERNVDEASAEGVNVGSEDEEVQSLPDYEREIEREIDAGVPPDERVLRFRATCFRVGKHCFGSMEAAREFGGELQDKFHWVVDLVNFNAEIILSLFKDSAQVSIALTKRSLHRRNISFFGPTTLRSTVCHNLLRLADIQPGDIVLDPLAGGGSIPIEGAMSFPGTFQVGGDIHVKAVSRFYSNVRVLKEEIGKDLALDALRWDSRRLPLREASVDVVVTDLPFGVRLGSKAGNRSLYRRVLLDMARVTRPGTGRAILLTQDRKSFSLALVSTMGLWWQSRVMSANIGGLDAAVFTLRRTSKIRPEESDFTAAQPKEQGSWRGGPPSGGSRGGQRNWGRGGRGRGRGYPRGKPSSSSRNWRDSTNESSQKANVKTEEN